MDTESFTILLSLSCTTSHPWVSLNASRADQCGAGWNRTKGLTSTHRTSRGDTPSAPRSCYLLTPTHTNTDTTQKNSPHASIPSPLHIHTQGNLSSWRHIRLSLSRPLSFLVLSLPRPPVGPSIHASLEYVIHTHTSLGPAKCINYTFTHVTSRTPLIQKALSSCLFRIQHSFWIKCGQKIILEFLHIYYITKLYGGVRTLICIAWCPQWYLFRTVNLYIFILYTKLVIIKRNEEHLSLSIAYPPLYAPFTYAHRTISRSSKSKPLENSRVFHLSLVIYAMTIIVFEANAPYIHWTS